MAERDIQWEIRERLGRDPRVVLWRNNQGSLAIDPEKTCPKCKASIPSKRKGRITYGVGGAGGSDLVGILRGSARWFVLEVKTPIGRATEEQVLFIDLIRAAGGFGAFVRSVDDAVAALERAVTGACE
jgi:hypothetical protein